MAINEPLTKVIAQPLIPLSLSVPFVAAGVLANHHDSLTLSPAEHSVVRYTNESLIVQCRAPGPDVKLHWKSPKGEIVREHKGRIHIEQTSPGEQVAGYRLPVRCGVCCELYGSAKQRRSKGAKDYHANGTTNKHN